MADDNDSQESSIKFYFEAFLPYICECVSATDLLVHLPFFNKAERKEIFHLSTTRPHQATRLALETLLKKNEDGIYTAIKEAMEQANQRKVFDILSGKGIPSPEEDHYNAVIQLFMNELVGRINPTEMISYLYREDIIGIGEKEEITCEERNHGQRRAAWLLLYYLPQRKDDWFKVFLKSLILMNHHDLANKLDPDLYTKITAQLNDSAKNSTASADEVKEDVLEVFEDAVDDTKLLNAFEEDHQKPDSVEEKYDQEKSEKNIVGERSPSVKAEETTVKSLTEELTPKVKTESKNEASKSLFSIENLDSCNEPKLPDKEIPTNNNPLPGKGLTLKYDPKVLRRLQHSKLACFPMQAFLRFPELFDSDSNKSVTESVSGFKAREKLVTHNQNLPLANKSKGAQHQDQTYQETNNQSVGAKASPEKEPPEGNTRERSSLQENLNLDLSNFLLPEIRPKKKSTGDFESEETLKRLLDSLAGCNLTPVDDEGGASVIYNRTRDDSQSENENDLNRSSPTPDLATDFDNIENEIEKEIPLREYQKELAKKGCEGKNVIILAPTNSGKTWVACRIIQEHFRKNKGHKIAKCAFVVENTALAQQQGECCAELLSHLRTKVISGETQRDKREYLKDFVDRRDILVVTAKVLHNTLKQKEIESITKFSIIIFDECHHTQADHPYNEIMHIYHDAKSELGYHTEGLPQIVGLTASLGVGKQVKLEKAVEHMQSLMANLDANALCRVQKNQAELEHIQNNPDEEIIVVPRRINDYFRRAVSDVMKAIEGLIKQTRARLSLADAVIIDKLVKSIPSEKGSQPYIQWLSNLRKRLVEVQSEDIRRVLNFCRLHLIDYNLALLLYTDARVEDALEILDKCMAEHRSSGNDQMEQMMFAIYEQLTKMDFKACSFNPKLSKIQEILCEVLGTNKDARGIIFVKTRQLAEYLIKWMKETDGLKDLNPRSFVGQTASVQVGGMTKHEQKDVLVYFKGGLHKLIVATSVAEEGLDITRCNLVIRYEHVTNEIVRTQSRGRARAPGSRYYVITGQGSPIADKEEKNAEAEKLMNKAAIALERHIQKDQYFFEMQLRRLQLSARLTRETKAQKKAQRNMEGDFEFRCFHCNNFICMSSDIRTIQGSHHVCVADDVNERVIFHRDPMPQFEESDVKMDGATYCNVCMRSLGGVFDYKGIEFPLIRIKEFRLVDRNGKGSHNKKWKGAPCAIQEIELEDLRKVAHRESDSD